MSLIRVELTEGEARALLGADAPESYSETYPYHLLERAQLNVERAMRDEPRLPQMDDARPPLPANEPRLVIRRPKGGK